MPFVFRTSWYNELINATADTIIGTIPAQNSEELALWEELRSDLREVIDDSSKLVSTSKQGL